MLEKQEVEALDKGWVKIMVIWIAMLSSLVFYLVIAMAVGDKIPVSMQGEQLKVLKYVLFGVSIMMLAGAFFLRKLLISKNLQPSPPGAFQSSTHPAVARYLVMIIVIMAMSESIGIYGLVLFFISKDTVSFYQLMALSAIAMIIFRPQKDELMDMAEKMKPVGG